MCTCSSSRENPARSKSPDTARLESGRLNAVRRTGRCRGANASPEQKARDGLTVPPPRGRFALEQGDPRQIPRRVVSAPAQGVSRAFPPESKAMRDSPPTRLCQWVCQGAVNR